MRRAVVVVLILAVLGMAFSAALTSAFCRSHDCVGDGCHICAVISTLSFASVKVQFLILALATIPFVTAAVRFFCGGILLPREKTPVVLCDEQNN